MKRLKEFIHTHKKWEPLVFFIAGFTFDAFLLHRIDDPLMLAHQALYLSLSAFLIAWDLLVESGKAHVPDRLLKIWGHRESALHFLLGTLLNVYTIFYFKSGTLLSSIVFLIILAALLALNELRPTRISKHVLRNALFALCLVSYSNIMVSILVGSIGPLTFIAAIGAAGIVQALFVRMLKSRLDPGRIAREIFTPFLVVSVVYTALYIFKVLPPVPLSMKHIGIYHEVVKEGSDYRLGYTRAAWRFWESGDQRFEARAGDKIHCFVQVFSPTRFKDQLFVRWQYYDSRAGWTNADAIPLSVVGGRDEGFRGHTTKSNYQPGSWRVSIETNDGREVGRIGFEVILAENLETQDQPEMKYEFR